MSLALKADRHNQTASPKGLVAGLPYSAEPDQTSIIRAACDGSVSAGIGHLKWILVVEKEVR